MSTDRVRAARLQTAVLRALLKRCQGAIKGLLIEYRSSSRGSFANAETARIDESTSCRASACVSVSIRQHTSAYVSIRQLVCKRRSCAHQREERKLRPHTLGLERLLYEVLSYTPQLRASTKRDHLLCFPRRRWRSLRPHTVVASGLVYEALSYYINERRALALLSSTTMASAVALYQGSIKALLRTRLY